MRAGLALMALMPLFAGLASGQAPALPAPEFYFAMDEVTYSTFEDLEPGQPMEFSVTVRRICPLEVGVLDEQKVLVTLTGPAFLLESPLFLEYPAAVCSSDNEPALLKANVTALGTLNGSQSFTVRLDPQRPENDLHAPGEPITLLVGLVVATPAPVVEPTTPAPTKESPLPAAALLVLALLAVGSRMRRRDG
ncbi:MAG: hypothetical protein WC876_06180 [Candidatus Thermoplasmatota archaeon]